MNSREVHEARLPRTSTCSRPCAFEVKKTKKNEIPPNTEKKTPKYIHSSPATATTSRLHAVKHVTLVSPYSHSSSIDPGFAGFVEIGLACIHTYVYTCTAAAAPPVYVLVLYTLSGQRSFVFLCCDTQMYRRFRGCPVVLYIELFLSAWYHKTQHALLRARRLLLLLLLAAESKERRLAVCGITFKPASNGAETEQRFRANQNTRKIRRTQNTPLLKKHFFSSRNLM